MGGSGSGPRYYHGVAKATVEDTYKLPISLFQKYLRESRCWTGSIRWKRGEREEGSIGYTVQGSEGVRLNYTVSKGTPQEQAHNYLIRVTATSPNYGGVRFWWLCPACSRRCGTLYGSGRYLCRQCHGLTYESCQKSHEFDSMYRFLARQMGTDAEDIRTAFEWDRRQRRNAREGKRWRQRR